VAISVLAGLVLAVYVAVLYSSLFEGNDIHTKCSWCESINCVVSRHEQKVKYLYTGLTSDKTITHACTKDCTAR
jgi:hypothetical protein